MTEIQKDNKNIANVPHRRKSNTPCLRFPGFTEEWEVKKFSEYIKLFRGSSPRPIVNFVTKDKNGVNWIKIGDTKNANNSIINNVEEKITIEGARKSRKVTSGELILANSMSFGKVYQLSIDGCIYDGWFVLREYENYFEKSFLLQLLNSDYLQKQYKRLSAGGIVQNISSEIVYETILIRPSFQEQQKIASFLSLIDERIQTQIKIIEQLKTLIKGLHQKLFFLQTPNVKLKDCVSCHSSSLTEAEILNETGIYPIFGATGIISCSGNYQIDEDAIMIIKDGSGVGKVQYGTGEFSVIGTLNYLTVKSDVNLKYIFFCLKFFNFEKYKVGSGIPHIYFKDYGEALIYCPSLDEQNKIEKLLSSIDEKINLENTLLQKLKDQKKHLLQNLFI
ncbi:restriction endonuclease subunit S [Chryseobacterium sp.]|uniref:restriction endonuclease subunit S n=1 Tax=Chryseobacterium sp. TaxID=1871047 RepID=UPI0025C0B06B|nr:restriction endonuclease subunit S [Chryseobacterium sp.]